MKKLLSVAALCISLSLTAANGGEHGADGAAQMQPVQQGQPVAQPIVQPIHYVVQPIQLAVPYQPQMDRAKRRKLASCKPSDEEIASARAQEAAERAAIPQGQPVPENSKSVRQSLIDLRLNPADYGY